jgi:hypothetical protein
MWSWQRLPGEDEDYELLNPKGKMVARIRQEGAHWWVARPRCIPEPPLESLNAACRGAIHMALGVLPEGVAENRAKNRAIVQAVLEERQLYPWRFSDAGERYARSRGGGASKPMGAGRPRRLGRYARPTRLADAEMMRASGQIVLP